MSQDLLSFLDEPEPKAGSGQTSGPSTFQLSKNSSRNSPAKSAQHDWMDDFRSETSQAQNASPAGQIAVDNANDEDEDFGDFEDASPAPVPASKAAPATSRSQPEPPKPTPPAKEGRSPFPPKSPKPTSKPDPSTKSKPPPKKTDTASHPFAGRMDLLFDNDDDDYDAGADELGDLANNPEAAMEYSKRIIAEQEESAKGKGKGKSAAGQRGGFIDMEEVKQQGMKGVKAKDPNVLFDAEDVSDDGGGDEDDDFGDFETWEQPPSKPAAISRSQAEPLSSEMDLLGLDDTPQPQSAAKVQSPPPGQSQKSMRSNGSHAAQSSTTSIWQRQDDDFWDDFETTAASSRKQPPAAAQPQQDDTWPDFEDLPAPSSAPPKSPLTRQPKPSSSNRPQESPPPTNIPPPLILLSLFPSLFASADDALFTAMSKLDLKSRQMLLSHPASHQFLRGYLSHIFVLARIIAGRKLRWKRDQRLSQGMRIGPSAAGGKGGMKLAGLDKSEVAKEDQEVLDMLRQYRVQIGKLRSAVTAASSAPGLPKLSSVPEIAETMPVKALKQSEGGFTAPQACALCGLRREERVVKLDDMGGGVQDSFGEWWVERTSMHVGCKAFWEEFEGKLKSR